MPIKPYPLTFNCLTCGWKKTVTPLSDALRPGEYFERCPKCNSENIQITRASAFDALLAKLRLSCPHG